MKCRKGMDTDGRCVGEDIGGVEGSESIIRIYYLTKSISSNSKKLIEKLIWKTAVKLSWFRNEVTYLQMLNTGYYSLHNSLDYSLLHE